MPSNSAKKTKKTTNTSVKNKRLGKGLDAIFGGDITSLIDDIEHNTPASKQVQVPLDQIRPNPYQPRKLFDEEKLQELAVSIREHGVFQPVILKASIQGYEIVAGERRCRAAKIAGLDQIPAIIVEFTDQQMMEIALLENIQREDLNSIEEAQAYQQMMERLNLTQEELGKRIGKSRSYIANTLRLLQLPEKIQNYVLEGKLSMGHARCLITLSKEKAESIAKRCIDENLSVRDVENIVKGIELGKSRRNAPKVEKPKEYKYVEDILRKKFRTKIKVDEKTVTIKYTDTKDLNRILELMGVIEES
ncbi:ParB/RepB/Spo0J family partition protein [Thomasclavelia sp.]|uniref:ParB/RepB/Spo0J family partition protein n=1 Tax=Thomasclavelia sp. TaxID=3025757 RepID=UPI00260055BB|nr:ParB/RepB/Spo0J family partition protein [Thomasclavelia sp.]